MTQRRLILRALEDRLVPTVGDLLHTLTPPTDAALAGTSVAASIQYAVVGAIGTNVNSLPYAGSAAIYDANSGSLLWNLLDPSVTGGNGDLFGQSVAVSGTRVVVGAPWYQPTTGQPIGQAYLFDATTGQLVHTLVNPEPDPTAWSVTGSPEQFADAVAIIGNTAFVSADYDPVYDPNPEGHTGAVLMFDVTTGNYIGKITPPGGLLGITFGAALATSGSLLAVSAPLAGANVEGEVFVYDTTVSLTTPQWTIDEPTTPAPGILDDFGRSVALQGSTLVVGAPRRDLSGNTDVGVAYEFNLPGGSAATLQQTLNIPHPDNASEFFGQGVAISNNAVIVGAPSDDTNSQFNGQAYIFNATTGAELTNAANPVTNGNANFGWSAAAAGDRLVVGARMWDTAYIFEGLPGTPPTANNDSFHVNENSQTNPLNVLANDSSQSPETLIMASVTQPSHGTVAIAADGKSVTYTPTASYTGSDSFTYKAMDSGGTSASATVTVTVDPVDRPPTAVDDSANILENAGPTSINVLANDSDSDNDPLSITNVTQPAHGTVAITGGGTGLTYAPVAGFVGAVSFTYTISDGRGGTDTASVAVTVEQNANHPPEAVDDTATLAEDAGAQTIDVLANDTDPDAGDTLTVTAVTQGQHGTVAIAAGGSSITYNPAPNFAGTDSFLYAESDGRGGTDYAAVNVTVNNDVADRLEVVTSSSTLVFTEGNAPVAVDPGLRVSNVNVGLKKAQARITSGYVHGRDVLVFPAMPGFKGSFNASTGVLTIAGAGSAAAYQLALRSVRFKNTSPMPIAGFRTVTFTVSDALGTGDPALRKIQVIEVNTPPVVTLTDPAVAYKENHPAVAIASTIKVVDLDNTILAGASVAITAGFAAGQDVLSATLKPGIAGAYDAGTGVLTLTGPVTRAAYQAVLRTVKYRNSSDGPTSAARTISFTVSDGTATSAAATRVVGVIPMNDAPVLDTAPNPSLPDVPKGNSNPAGTRVATLLGTAVTDPDLGAQQGIAITGLSGTGLGTWQFSTDGGTTWLTVGTVSPLRALLLRSTDMLRFVPSGSLTGTASINYRAWDQTVGTAGSTMAVGTGGGTSAFSLATETATVNVV